MLATHPVQDAARAKRELALYRRDRRCLANLYDVLLRDHPDEWAAVADGQIFHAAKLDVLFAKLRLEGIDPASVPRTFLAARDAVLIL